MKDLGKTIAKYRKEHKLNQSQLAKELENYDIYVKQNSISAWELGTATPNARQFLALCEILEIYDIYTDFIGQSPLNPFRNLNETGMNKVLEYIRDLESTGNYKPADIEQTACLDDGEIGIFYLDGNAYVKKFQNNRLGTYLISLNKKYDPIPVTENSSFKIFGRVLS